MGVSGGGRIYKGFLEEVAGLPSGRWNWGSAHSGNSGGAGCCLEGSGYMEKWSGKAGTWPYLLGQVTSLWDSAFSFLKFSPAVMGDAHNFGSCKLLNFLCSRKWVQFIQQTFIQSLLCVGTLFLVAEHRE